MPKSGSTEKAIELLEKLLAVQLHTMDVPQGKIAKIVGKSKTWVNALLKGIPSSQRGSKGAE